MIEIEKLQKNMQTDRIDRTDLDFRVGVKSLRSRLARTLWALRKISYIAKNTRVPIHVSKSYHLWRLAYSAIYDDKQVRKR